MHSATEIRSAQFSVSDLNAACADLVDGTVVWSVEAGRPTRIVVALHWNEHYELVNVSTDDALEVSCCDSRCWYPRAGCRGTWITSALEHSWSTSTGVWRIWFRTATARRVHRQCNHCCQRSTNSACVFATASASSIPATAIATITINATTAPADCAARSEATVHHSYRFSPPSQPISTTTEETKCASVSSSTAEVG